LVAWMKFAGYDAIVIEGAAKSPTWLRIEDDKVTIEDASKLWGKGTVDTQKSIHEIMGKEACVASIGPAGEKQKNFGFNSKLIKPFSWRTRRNIGG